MNQFRARILIIF